MKGNNKLLDIIFSRAFEDFGTIHLRRIDLDTDINMIHDWVTKPYASYWGMLDKSIDDIQSEYAKLAARESYDVFIGLYEDKPMFIMEKYKASSDRISEYYSAKDTDYGMHILVAPPEYKISGFTWNVFTTVLEYFFCLPHVDRVVVEPDVLNEKIHKLNKKAGFQYQKEIELPEKIAALAFCGREDFKQAKKKHKIKEIQWPT